MAFTPSARKRKKRVSEAKRLGKPPPKRTGSKDDGGGGEKKTPDFTPAKKPGVTRTQVGGEKVETRIVGKKEAFATAKAAGGTPPEQTTKQARHGARGLKNVLDVAGIAVNPFSKDRIAANVDNKIVEWGLETAANNPYTTALYTSGLISLGRGVLGKAAGAAVGPTAIGTGDLGTAALKEGTKHAAKKTAAGTAAKYATNTKTRRLTGNLFAVAGFTTAAAFFIMKLVETYPFSKFEVAESMDKIAYARGRASKEENWEIVDRLDQLQREVLNPEGWDYIVSKIPQANLQQAANTNINAALEATKAYQKLEKPIREGLKQEPFNEFEGTKFGPRG